MRLTRRGLFGATAAVAAGLLVKPAPVEALAELPMPFSGFNQVADATAYAEEWTTLTISTHQYTAFELADFEAAIGTATSTDGVTWQKANIRYVT